MAENAPIAKNLKYRRIATEEAWAPQELLDMYADLFNSKNA